MELGTDVILFLRSFAKTEICHSLASLITLPYSDYNRCASLHSLSVINAAAGFLL